MKRLLWTRGGGLWIFTKVETDAGITGYGECSDGRNPNGVVGTIKDLTPLLIGKDPRAYEMRFWDMIRGSRQSPGGIAAKAIAGIECALVDIKAKAFGNFRCGVVRWTDARRRACLLVALREFSRTQL